MSAARRARFRRGRLLALAGGALFLSGGCAELLGIDGEPSCVGHTCSPDDEDAGGGRDNADDPTGGRQHSSGGSRGPGGTSGTGGKGGDAATSGGSDLGGGGAGCSGCGCEDGTCPSDCTVEQDADCRPLGVTCEAAEQCESGRCSDGVCCDRRCTGLCESCDQEGLEGYCSANDFSADGANCGSCNNVCLYGVCDRSTCAETVLGVATATGQGREYPPHEIRCAPIQLEQRIDMRVLGVHSTLAGVRFKLALFDTNNDDEADLPVELVREVVVSSVQGRSHGDIGVTQLEPGKYFICILADQWYQATDPGDATFRLMAQATRVTPYDEGYSDEFSPPTEIVPKGYVPDLYAVGFPLE